MINTTDIFSMPQKLKTYIYNKLNGIDINYEEIKTELKNKKSEGEDVGGKYIAVGNYIDILTNGDIVSMIKKTNVGFVHKADHQNNILRVLNIKVKDIEKLIE